MLAKCCRLEDGGGRLVGAQSDEAADSLPGPTVDTTPPAAPSASTGTSYVSPAYVKGGKAADAVNVLWRYKGTETWYRVGQTTAGGYEPGVCADTWWWTEMDLHRCGKSKDLSLEDRQVEIELKSADAAGNESDIASHTLTWNLTSIGGGTNRPTR